MGMCIGLCGCFAGLTIVYLATLCSGCGARKGVGELSVKVLGVLKQFCRVCAVLFLLCLYCTLLLSRDRTKFVCQLVRELAAISLL